MKRSRKPPDQLGHAVFFEERFDRGSAARRFQVLLPQRSRVAHRVADEEQNLDPAEPRGQRGPRHEAGVVVQREPRKELLGRQHRPRRTGGADDHPQAQFQFLDRTGSQPQAVALADFGPLLGPDTFEYRIGEAAFRECGRVLAQRRLQPGRTGLVVTHVQVEGGHHPAGGSRGSRTGLVTILPIVHALVPSSGPGHGEIC